VKLCTATLLAAVLTVTGCSGGRYPDREFQICLENQRGIDDFKQILVAIAGRYKLKFFDQSQDREQRLKDIMPDQIGKYPLQDFHIHDKAQGVEITASNLTLGRYQTSISWDLRNARQRLVAVDLESALRKRFKLRPFPEGSGALPLQNCPASTILVIPAKAGTQGR
jgi:hypothetical protein